MPDEALLRTRSIEALQCFVKRHRFAGMQAGFVFPQFVGHRRRLPPDHELFAEGNLDRELLAKQVAMQVRAVHAQERVRIGGGGGGGGRVEAAVLDMHVEARH